jgi:isopentenyl-diphosphate delta-isomerase
MATQVVLVDESDLEMGLMEKMEAHLQGRLHRAISIFLFNEKGETLIQQRAFSKYHCPGLWSNTCCSHPYPGETPQMAAERRLFEELGIQCELKWAFPFLYKAEVGNGLIEHEYDHVFIGRSEGEATLNPLEVEATKWVLPRTLLEEFEKTPEKYTVWFRLLLGATVISSHDRRNYL